MCIDIVEIWFDIAYRQSSSIFAHIPGPAEPAYALFFANSVDLDQLASSVGCAVRLEARRSRVQPCRGPQHSFVEIDHEIFSTVILSLP